MRRSAGSFRLERLTWANRKLAARKDGNTVGYKNCPRLKPGVSLSLCDCLPRFFSVRSLSIPGAFTRHSLIIVCKVRMC
jgi:hypothetical protein